MNIRITGRLGETRAEPLRAEVSIGERVQWTIEVASARRLVRSVLWEVYFEGMSPFRQRSFRITTPLRQPPEEPPFGQLAVYEGQIIAGETVDPGEYKYGVRAFDDASGDYLGDDDPWIVVWQRLR